jgi:subtilisin family serine protease
MRWIMKPNWYLNIFMAIGISLPTFLLIGAKYVRSVKSSPANNSPHFSQQTEVTQPEIVPGMVVVKLKSTAVARSLSKVSTITGLSSLDARLQRLGALSVQKMFRHKPIPAHSAIPDISCFLKIRIPEQLNPVMVAQELENDSHVEYAEPIYVRRLLATPNDPMYSQQWHLPQIKAPQAWDVQKGDSTVIIAILDTGVDYDHVDLTANVWTNAAEANGSPGVDDDGNGFVDDIHGWDFGDEDADPNDQPSGTPSRGHGTGCAGLACAVTSNGIGVAGVSWNCRFMAIKISQDNSGDISSEGPYQGIIYAVDNGADIISNSWGGDEYSKWEQEVIDYAYSKGAVIVCAACNANSETVFYPASYRHTISIAAVGPNDVKTYYSNYGPWIDLCAPSADGVSWLLTTYPDNQYQNFGGTSGATPVASGVFGLVKSLHPDWSNEQIVRQVLLTADNIYGINPQYQYKLGHGRVNAYRALRDSTLIEPDARLAILNCTSDDSTYGNNDGILDPGETIRLHINIQNCSIGNATAASFQISDAGSDIEIIDGTAGPVAFPAESTLPFNFSFRIVDQASAQKTNLILTMTTDRGYSREEEIGLTVGVLPVLLVDYDLGYPQVEPFFFNILDEKNLPYAYWDAQLLGFPAARTLSRFPILLISASATGSLTERTRPVLKNYLDGSGRLFICGQSIGSYSSGIPGVKDFLRDYFHLEYTGTSDNHNVVGIMDDPISYDLSFQVWQPSVGSWQWPEVIRPLADASPVFTYSDGQVCAVKFEGDYKVVYFGFGLEAVDSQKDTPIGATSPIRTEVLRRTMNWLNFIVHEPLKDTEKIQNSHQLIAAIKGNLPDFQSINVCWRLQGEDDFKTIPMTEIENAQYTAEIPGTGSPATVEYYLQASYPGFNWFCPIGAPDSIYTYYAGPDTVKPEITQVSRLPNRFSNRESYPVSAIITDNLGIDSSSVFAHYQVSNRNVIDSVLLTATGEANHFSGELPAIFQPGDSVAYRVTLKDQSLAGNSCASPWQDFLVSYEDFENGLADWQVDSSGWSLSETCHRGKYSVCTSSAGSYQTNLDISLTSKYGVDLSQTDKAVLTFWTAYFMEQDKDFGIIEISTDSTKTWQRQDVIFTGVQGSWKEESISLSNFTGSEFTDVRLRFRFISDSTQTQPLMGWFIDDMRIIPEELIGIAVNDLIQQEHFSLSQNYPNPFNNSTMINYQLPMTCEVYLSIYNILGQKVATLVAEKQQVGSYKVAWDASKVASGVYLYRLKAGSFTEVRKMAIMK